MRPQLTISLLTSNQIHAIRRCLDSLVPILMQIPSELIIVDTSEEESVRELVSQYTDHVIPFQWCDDFSKARNVGLREAHGEWFMFIDDDEWLEETGEIIAFFASGEYKGYNSATYQVRNYKELAGRYYVDAYVPRMVRLTPETNFFNRIHEYIAPYEAPVKKFSVYAHHYGYADRNADMKTLRNVPLLEKEMQEKAFTAHNYLQLCQEYMSDYQFGKAEMYALKCLELEEEGAEKEKSWCLAYLTFFIFKQGDFQRAIETGKELLRHPRCTEIASLRIYMDVISACEKLGGLEKKIIVYAKSYHAGISRLDARPEEWFLQSMGGLGEQQAKSMKNLIYMSGLQAAVWIKDQNSVKDFLRWFPWESDEIERYYAFFYGLLQDEKNGSFFEDQFVKVEVENELIFLVKAQAAWRAGDLRAAREYHKVSVCSNNRSVQQEAALLSFQSGGKISLGPLMGCIDVTQWTYISEYIVSRARLSELEDWIKVMEDHLSEFPIQTLAVLIVLQERLLIEGIEQISDRELFQKMRQYCRWVLQYASFVYNEYMQSPEHMSLMPKTYRFALEMEKVYQGIEKADHLGVLQGLQRAIGIYQPLCGAIRRMLPVVEGELEKAGRSSEFEMLGTQVKQMIYDLIEENRYIDAVPLIQQLSLLLPRDLEVLRLRQRLWEHSIQ